MSNSGAAAPEVVKSADRVLDLLELLGSARRPMTLAEIAAELDIPKSSTLALLRTLLARGYAARDADECYALALPFGQEEGDWLGGLPRRVAILGRPIVAALVEQTGETINLGAMLTSFQVRPLIQLASPRDVRYDPRGVDCPAYCSAMGRALLAFMPEATVERCLARDLSPMTPHTLTEPAQIRVKLAQARRQGYAEIEEEYVDGASGVAAPVFDRDGRAVAVVNLATLTRRWHQHRAAYTAAVLAAAAELTDKLGGVAPGAAGRAEVA